jgi:hypothetical protein
MNTTQSLLRFAALIVAVNHGLLLVCPLAIGRAEEDLRCLAAPPDAPDPTTVVYADLQQQAYAALARRQTAFEQLKTPEQIQTYQENLRKFFIEQLGGFPDRSPLNARTVGSLDGDGYRVEKVIFASQPQHHITALLFLPTGPAPLPGRRRLQWPQPHGENGRLQPAIRHRPRPEWNRRALLRPHRTRRTKPDLNDDRGCTQFTARLRSIS